MLISVKVIPKARKVQIKEIGEGEYKVYLTSPPVDGKANDQLIEVLAEFFSVRKRDIVLIKGHHSQRKILEVKGGK